MNPEATPYKVTFSVEDICNNTIITSRNRLLPLRSPTLTAADQLQQLKRTEGLRNELKGHLSQPYQSNTLQDSTRISSNALDLTQPKQQSKMIRYSKEELLGMQKTVLQAVAQDPVVEVPPFKRVPISLAPLLKLPYAPEFIDIEASVALANDAGSLGDGITHCVPSTEAKMLPGSCISPFSGRLIGAVFDVKPSRNKNIHQCYHRSVRACLCSLCSQGRGPCAMLRTVLQQIMQQLLGTRLGVCLLQSDKVVWAQLQLALVFEDKKSSLRMRLIAEQHPGVVRRVSEYLYGEGYHLKLPAVTAHDEWTQLTKMLKFDAIRDNVTRIKTDLSKRWRQYHTPFEQFVFFFSFRDDRQNRAVKNIVTRSVKPGIVAILTGDLVAMYLLHKLGFFIPPDYYWEVFLFMKRSAGRHGAPQTLVRHFALYLSSKQSPDIFNPVENICMGTNGLVR